MVRKISLNRKNRRRRLKLVSGDGHVVEVERSRTVIEGRIIKAYSEQEH